MEAKGKRVLIAAPIAGLKQYSINQWITWIAKQTHQDFDVALCCNGKDKFRLTEMIRQITFNSRTKENLHPIVMILANDDQLSIIEKITYSREKLRRYAEAHDYDYLFFLDTDTIPLRDTAIEDLISWGMDAISGLYFYKNSAVAVALDNQTLTNVHPDRLREAYDNNSLIVCCSVGYGCMMLSRKAFQVPFDFKIFGEFKTDDIGHSYALTQKGFSIYLSPRVMCQHISDGKERQKILARMGSDGQDNN